MGAGLGLWADWPLLPFTPSTASTTLSSSDATMIAASAPSPAIWGLERMSPDWAPTASSLENDGDAAASGLGLCSAGWAEG